MLYYGQKVKLMLLLWKGTFKYNKTQKPDLMGITRKTKKFEHTQVVTFNLINLLVFFQNFPGFIRTALN